MIPGAAQLYSFYKEHYRAVVSLAFASILCLAWWNRFIQDDAFISFRYAGNLARGWGLVWNYGERVEGYTNFLWTLIMSGVIRLGGDPVVWSSIFGICCFACSLIMAYRISLLIFQSDDASLITVVLLGTHYSFSAYATGGLETAAVTALFLSIVYMILWWNASKRIRPFDALMLSVFLTLSLLLRLDSAIICLLAMPVAIYQIWREPSSLRSRFIKLALLVSPFVILIGYWFRWKLSYYGDILPNTFYIKVVSVQSITRGLHFLHRYLVSYYFYPFLLLAVFAARRFFRPFQFSMTFIFVLVVVWVTYVVKIGGDFMEFRFLVPVMPFFFILISWLIFIFIQSAVIRSGFIVLVIIGLFYHTTTFEYRTEDGIEPIRQLSGHLTKPDEHWGEIGKVLGAAFNYDPSVSIATTAAGAIPYYSKLTTIDMLGLSDKFVATQGYYFGRTAGHERIATFAYLKQRNVNLIIAHPYVIQHSESMVRVPLVPGITEDNLSDAKAVEIPIDELYKLVVLYLTPNATVDTVITKNNWKVHQFGKQ